MKQSKEEVEIDKKINQLEQIRIQYPLMPYRLYKKIYDYFKEKSLTNSNNNEMKNLVINLITLILLVKCVQLLPK